MALGSKAFKQGAVSLLCITVSIITSCCQDNSNTSKETREENRDAKSMFQGIWIDEESENVIFKVEGDSVYYPDKTCLPAFFTINEDTLIIGAPPSHYLIQKQTTNIFWFKNHTGDLIKLYKSSDQNSELVFTNEKTHTINSTKVLKKDTIVTYNAERYHCYIAINPTKYKITRRFYNDDGVEVDNVYYDNIIHVSVYQGAKCLYACDFKKSMFSQLVPQRFLTQAVLRNIEYDKVDSDGFHFNATLCIPDAASCYFLKVNVSFDSIMNMEVIDY